MDFYESLDKQQLKGVNLLEEFILGNDKMFLFEGQGGSGKTYCISRLVFKNTDKIKYAFLCPTHKALAVLKKTIKEFSTSNNIDVPMESIETFSTIARFFIKKLFYDKNGKSIFKSSGTKIKTTCDERLLEYKDDETLCLIVDECSMINYQQFEDFMKLTTMYPFIKIIFLGDRNQLPYIKKMTDIKESLDVFEEELDIEIPKDLKTLLTGFVEYTQFLSPVFTKIDNTFKLKSFKRSDKKDLKDIIFFLKNCVVKNKFMPKKFFRLINKSENANELTIAEFKKLIKGRTPLRGIAHTNKQKDVYNNIIRKLLFNKHPNYKTYKYVEKDVLIFNQSVFSKNDDPEQFYNNMELRVESSMYDLQINLEFGKLIKGFGINYQFMETTDIETLEKHNTFQVSLKDELRFDNFCKTIRKFFIKKFKSRVFLTKCQTQCLCNVCEDVIRYNDMGFFDDGASCCLVCQNKLQRIYKKQLEELNNRDTYTELMSQIDAYHHKFNMPCSYAYCVTIAKSQGSTFENVLYVHNTNTFMNDKDHKKTMTRNIYTAVSRTSHKLYVMKNFL